MEKGIAVSSPTSHLCSGELKLFHPESGKDTSTT
jgi:hypothetical protein